jgi:cytosine/adenosine deaminase-related metal-dependent hydrolase
VAHGGQPHPRRHRPRRGAGLRGDAAQRGDHVRRPLLPRRRIADAVVRTGIRADIAPTYFSSRGRAALEESAEVAAALHGTGDGRVTASLGPHAPYTVDDKDLVRLAELARETGLRIHIHAAEHLEQTESSLARRGITPITVLERTGVLDAGALIAHGCGIVPDDLPTLAAHRDRTGVACCPKVYLKHALPRSLRYGACWARELPSGPGRTGRPGTTRWTCGRRCGWSR